MRIQFCFLGKKIEEIGIAARQVLKRAWAQMADYAPVVQDVGSYLSVGPGFAIRLRPVRKRQSLLSRGTSVAFGHGLGIPPTPPRTMGENWRAAAPVSKPT